MKTSEGEDGVSQKSLKKAGARVGERADEGGGVKVRRWDLKRSREAEAPIELL